MQYTITGSLGNISKSIVAKLVAAGHTVSVISSNSSNKTAIEALGAKPLIGSVEDREFLVNAFAGADGVYLMIPPNFAATDWKRWIGSIGTNYAYALNVNQTKFAVNLSSVGADQEDGCGPVSGLHLAEAALNALTGTKVLHLRPSYFYLNFLSNLDLIRTAGIMGSNFGGKDFKFPLTDVSDIASVATDALLNPVFNHGDVSYIVSDERTSDEIAAAIGAAIGKPELPWVVFADDQAYEGMTGAGLPPEIAKNYVEMGQALRSGKFTSHYEKTNPGINGKIRLNDFAKTFAAVYNN